MDDEGVIDMYMYFYMKEYVIPLLQFYQDRCKNLVSPWHYIKLKIGMYIKNMVQICDLKSLFNTKKSLS